MNWFKNLKTMTKLLISFVLISCVMAGVGYFGISGMSTIDEALETLYERDLIGLNAAHGVQEARLTIGRFVRDAELSDDATLQDKSLRGIDDQDLLFRSNLDEMEKGIILAENKAGVTAIRQTYELMLADARLVVRAAMAKDAAVMHPAHLRVVEAGNLIADRLNKVIAAKLELGKKAHEESKAVYSTLRSQMLWLIAIGLGLGIFSGVFVGRVIGKPLGQAVSVLEAVAGGDFTRELDVDSKDEVGLLARALNEAVTSVRDALNGVRDVANSVATASGELAASADEISGGAQEQAASLEETAASLEEITSTVKQNGDNAQQASRLATGSRDIAAKGGRIVSSAVQAMGEITQSSKKIADIITTIDEIAFQTNLLALNAAVEAARAGEQGRGFAVVATEVRNLAQRSAAASKEIKALIGDSLSKVEKGSEHVNQSGTTLEEIVGSVKRVTDIVAEIAAATREQNTGLDQVNQAISQLDQVTQSNAAQTEELSSTAEALSRQAAELQTLVAKFRTGSATVAAPARPARAKAVRKAPPGATAKRTAPVLLPRELNDSPTAIVTYAPPPPKESSRLEEF